MIPQGSDRVQLVILDDDPVIVRLLTKVIERDLREMVEITAFTDPSRAEAWLDANLRQVLVSDIQMPDKDGLEILRFVKRRNPWTQVIVMTAFSTWDRIDQAIEAGASDYLLKPIDQVELLDLLRQAIARLARWQSAVAGTFQP